MKNLKKVVLIIFVTTILAMPLLTFAIPTLPDPKVCSETVNNIGDIICRVSSILNLIIPVLILLGIVYFVWGIVTYFIGDDEEAKKTGKNRIIYGLIGFVVIFALQGLINIVINTFGLTQSTQIVSGLIQNNSNIVGANLGTCELGLSPKLGTLLNYATCLINKSVIPLIVALAVAMFIWGVVQYVINNEEEAKRAKGKEFMIWGIIGLAVMIGVWGLVKILGSTFGIEYAIPQLK